MKISTITQTNQKGQLVIPVKLRRSLGIDQTTPLSISQSGNAILVEPINPTKQTEISRKTYLQLLKTTRGAWGKETTQDQQRKNQQRRAELKAAKTNKQPW